jgi:hypothetical protein
MSNLMVKMICTYNYGGNSVGMAFMSVRYKREIMENGNQRKAGAQLPDTTQKQEGTTSAFSAASHEDKERRADEQSKDDREPGFREDGTQGRATFHTGSTTQGGSNYGQGSGSLGPSSYDQGAEGNKGANYDNEDERFAETGTQADGTDVSKQDGTDPEHDGTLDAEEKPANDETTEDADTIGIP